MACGVNVRRLPTRVGQHLLQAFEAEHPHLEGGAPAAVSAVENATGIWADEIPVTPERLTAGQEAGEVVEGIAGEVAKRPSSED